jgi:hypothetical protein
MMDQFVAVATAILAGRAAMSTDDPEPQIAATALLGLWRVQFRALGRYLDGTRTPAELHRAVSADVHHAARLIDTGLSSFPVLSWRPALALPHGVPDELVLDGQDPPPLAAFSHEAAFRAPRGT